MLVWIFETIEYFMTNRSDLQLIIRIHPAELKGGIPSRQLVAEEIFKKFGEMPKNIKIVGPERSISTYSLMEICDSVIIFGTKTGVELTSIGIPVIVAGEAWIKNKGISIDPKNKTEYFEILNRLPLNYRSSEDQIERALKYAYHFFFRRMIPISYMDNPKSQNFYRLHLNSTDDLLPGKDKGLDVICDGIMNSDDFFYTND